MNIRTATPQDLPEIAELLNVRDAKYSLDACQSLTIAEENGEIVAVAGLVPCMEVIAVSNPKASPHRRMEALNQLHRPLCAESLRAKTYKGYVFLDPKFQGFRERLMDLGWERPLWQVLEIPRATIEEKAKS